MVKYNVKSSFWQKHDIFFQFMRSFCTWHFLENMFKRCRFWRKCLMKKRQQIEKSQNVKFDMKIKNRIITRYYFGSISTFWYTSIRVCLIFWIFFCCCSKHPDQTIGHLTKFEKYVFNPSTRIKRLVRLQGFTKTNETKDWERNKRKLKTGSSYM